MTKGTTLHRPLQWLDSQHQVMCDQLWQWSSINSGSMNLTGLSTMFAVLVGAFQELEAPIERVASSTLQEIGASGEIVDSSVGDILHLRKRPDAPQKILLCGHMDTVFKVDHAFQQPKQIDENRVNGPGVADMKGGLLVMLYALRAFEQSPLADKLGWEIIINADEEIGSLGSAALLDAAAQRNDFGLVFEPATESGMLAGERKGSGKFTVVLHGIASHVGRAFEQGRSAIMALANFLVALHELNDKRAGITINSGVISGGTAVNVVPDLAIARIGVRTQNAEDEAWFLQEFEKLIATANMSEGIKVEFSGGFTRKPKVLTETNVSLLKHVAACGQELGLALQWESCGGCCDGNNLAAAGLPNVDTMGVRGGSIHSDKEFIYLDSLVERAKLTALVLLQAAAKEM